MLSEELEKMGVKLVNSDRMFARINVTLKFKKLCADAVAPSKAHESDAGYDLTCISVEDNGDILTYHTGLAVGIPEGYVGLLFSRSSVYKKDLIQCNAVGVIDQGYHGELMFKFRKQQPFSKRYEVGDRIGQFVLLPQPHVIIEETENLEESDRGEGGFGSTGK